MKFFSLLSASLNKGYQLLLLTVFSQVGGRKAELKVPAVISSFQEL